MGKENLHTFFCMVRSEVEAHALNQFIWRENAYIFKLKALVIGILASFIFIVPVAAAAAVVVVIIFECLQGFDLHHDLESHTITSHFLVYVQHFCEFYPSKRREKKQGKREKRRTQN